jgi:hypothetical protein
MRTIVLGTALCALLASQGPVTAAAPLTINLSGNETFIGHVEPDGSVVGVRFQGWTGGSGPHANGWSGPPGNGGHWLTRVDYQCTDPSCSSLALTSGAFDLTLLGGERLSASATGGVVTRPPDLGSDIGCGAGIATLSVTLAFDDGASGGFTGCLDDQRSKPYRLWGTLTKS